MTYANKPRLAVFALVASLAVSGTEKTLGQANEPKDNPFSTLDKRASDLARKSRGAPLPAGVTSDWLDKARESLRIPLKPGQSPEIAAIACNSQAEAQFTRGHYASTGDFSLDSAVVFELLAIQARFDCSSGFCYFDDRGAKNACWGPLTHESPLPPLIPTRHRMGTMKMGREMAAELQRSGRDLSSLTRSLPIHGVLAHECGHMLQFIRRTQLTRSQQELLSDYLAGWSVGCEKRKGPLNIDEAVLFERFYKMGDNDIYSIGHHGRKEEREAAFRAGFNLNDDRLDEAYRLGSAYVQELKPPLPHTEERHSQKLGFHFVYCRIDEDTVGLALTRFPADQSPAALCGLEMHDYITQVNLLPLRSLADLENQRGKVMLRVNSARTDQWTVVDMDIP